MAEQNRVRVTVNPRLRELKDMFKLDHRDMRSIRDAVDIQFTQDRKRTFSTEGSAAGERWPALSPDYAAAKARKYPGRKIMQRSGRLRKSLVNRHDGEHVATYRIKPTPRITVGTTNIVAAYHGPKELAGALANPNVPVRDVMAHSQRQERALVSKVRDALIEKIDRVRRVLLAGSRVGR